MTQPRTQAQGQEVLVIDGDAKVQRGLSQLLRGAALMPTVLPEPRHALELAIQKFFAVALVDFDTPAAEGGLATLAELRRHSPATALVALVPHPSFQAAVSAFRAGADDVVVKAPEQVDYLRERVVALAAGRRRESESNKLVEQAAALHEEMIKVLLDTHKRALSQEEQRGLSATPADEMTHVLVVEESGWLGEQLGPLLDTRGGYSLTTLTAGGEALDLTGRRRFHVALIADTLPDLPGSIVTRSVKRQSPDTIVLLFSPPHGPRPGSVQVVETQRAIPFLPAFVHPSQLAERVDELREAFHAAARERRYLASFRQHHSDLLRRYAELKAKLRKAT